MLTGTVTAADTELFEHYFNSLKPIPLNGHTPDQVSLARWAADNFHWLHQGDPLAEQALLALKQAGHGIANPAEHITSLANSGNEACRALLADMHAIPAWVDFDVMRRAGHMAQRHFPMLILGLTYGGLPLTFGHPDAAEVFSSTGRMQANISRRLNESASLFFGIYNTDDLAPGKPMWDVCLHVRLVHSLVSQGLVRKGWDTERRGLPVNQLSTASGPAFFGTHQLKCLRLLGARISEDEAAGFTMVWRYVTRLLGVREELIGATQQQQDDFDQHITSLFFSPDDNARHILRELAAGLASQQPTARIPAQLQAALFRRLLGDTMADAYQIAADKRGDKQLGLLLPALKAYGWLQEVPLVSSLMRLMGKRVLSHVATEGIVRLDDAGSPQ